MQRFHTGTGKDDEILTAPSRGQHRNGSWVIPAGGDLHEVGCDRGRCGWSQSHEPVALAVGGLTS